MVDKPCFLVGIPVRDGAGRRGCELGPGALRAAGLATRLRTSGRRVVDDGDLSPRSTRPVGRHYPRARSLAEVVAWCEVVADAAYRVSAAGGIPVFLGGDHSLSIGTMAGLSRRAAEAGRDLFVLWLDAHPDLHTLDTTTSGNLHGTPLGYATGRGGFHGAFAPIMHPVSPADVTLLGVRSVDPAEDVALRRSDFSVAGIETLKARGAAAVLAPLLDRVAAANGWLHVSLDADFLDPAIAPGVGTPVPGGASLALAREVMDVVNRSGLVGSLDLAELNPLLDQDGVTARLLVDLAARLLSGDEATSTKELGSCPQSSTSFPSSASTT